MELIWQLVADPPPDYSFNCNITQIKLWNVETKTEIVGLNWNNGVVISVAFNHNGTLLASGLNDNTIILWNL